jgi:hypothetical protein
MLPQEGTPSEIERVFAEMGQQRPDAVLVLGEGDLYAHRRLIAQLAEKNRLLAMCLYRDYVDARGLMAHTVISRSCSGAWPMTCTKPSTGANRARSRFISPPSSSS